MKRLSILLVVILIFPALVGFVYAEESPLPETAAQRHYAENIKFLSSLGLYEFDAKDSTSAVKRSEFAEVIVNLLGLDLQTQQVKDQEPFIDVKSSDTYANAICILNDLEIMVGTSRITFAPDTDITYYQAVRVMVNALGYEQLMKATTDTEAAYFSKARSLGLLPNEAKNINTAISWSDAAVLFVRALDIEVLEVISIGEYTHYKTTKDSNLLSVYHKIYSGKGIVTDNGITALNGKSEIGSASIKIGDDILGNPSEEVRELIGCYVKYYYREDNNRTLLYATFENSKNKILTISAYNLAINSKDFKKTSITYYDGSKLEKADISPYADLIYNGSSYPAFVTDTLKIRSGTLKLINNDGNSDYNVIIIEEYYDICVASMNIDEKKIYDRYSAVIDYGDYKSAEVCDAAGNKINFGDIKGDTILSVFASKDNSKIKIIAETKSIDVYADEVLSDSDKVVVFSGGNEYRPSISFLDYMKMGFSDVKQIQAGKQYNFLLNFMGEIVIASVKKDDNLYAYFLGIKEGTFSTIQMKLFLETGDTVVATVADKVTINNTQNKVNASEVLKINDLYDGSGKVLPQLVKIQMNAKGYITAIETAGVLSQNAYGFDKTKFSFNYEGNLTNALVSTIGTVTSRIYNYTYNFNSDTKIFIVEELNNSLITTDNLRLRVVSLSKLPHPYYAFVKLYDANETWTVGACVLSLRSDYESQPLVVNEISKVINEKGEEIGKVNCWWKGNIWEFFESFPGVFKTGAPSGLKKGDIVRFSHDLDNNIDKIEVLCSPYTNKTPGTAIGDLKTATNSMQFGYPVAKSTTQLGIYTKQDDKYPYFVNSFNPKTHFFWVNLKEGSVKVSNVTQIPIVATITEDNRINITNTDIMVTVWRERGEVILCVIYEG